jgi:hypothetical protein
MKTLKKYFTVTAISLLCLIYSISCNYLDIVPDNVATIDYAFRNRTSCEKYLYTCYSYLPQHGDVSNDPGMAGGDEVWKRGVTTKTSKLTIQLAQGDQSAVNPLFNFWNGENGATVSLWRGIRDCNIFLENVDKVLDLPDYEKKRWIAEVKFLKAYYHFYLFRMYGPIPIMDVNTPVGASPDEVKPYREPVDAVVKYIVDLLDGAAEDLPLERDVIEGTEAGRINNLIAKSVKAKVLVYAASKLYNGNEDYAKIIDARGVRLFPQTPDPEKWKLAADACLEAIEMCHAQGKKLYDLVEPQLSTANDTFKIQTTYRQAICDKWNCELIWGSVNYNCGTLAQTSQPEIMFVTMEALITNPEYTPTMKLTEKYYSSHGVPINEDKEWISNGWYSKRRLVRPEPSSGAEKYLVKEGQQTAYLHYNREVRFYASIGFDRGIYFGSGYTNFPANVKHCEVRAKEYSGRVGAVDYSITGYFSKKTHSYKDAMTSSSVSFEYFPFPIIRLADLYLLYAEALNEYSGPGAEVFKYLDLIRARVGLEGVQVSWEKYSNNPQKPNNRETLRDIIYQERTIELALEGERFWDIRRWKKIDEFNEQPLGWNIMGETLEDFYMVTVVAPTPVEFSVKDYLWPIKESELVRNKKLIQNYGW